MKEYLNYARNWNLRFFISSIQNIFENELLQCSEQNVGTTHERNKKKTKEGNERDPYNNNKKEKSRETENI